MTGLNKTAKEKSHDYRSFVRNLSDEDYFGLCMVYSKSSSSITKGSQDETPLFKQVLLDPRYEDFNNKRILPISQGPNFKRRSLERVVSKESFLEIKPNDGTIFERIKATPDSEKNLEVQVGYNILTKTTDQYNTKVNYTFKGVSYPEKGIVVVDEVSREEEVFPKILENFKGSVSFLFPGYSVESKGNKVIIKKP